ncbi:MAG: hypothetical protein V1932_09185 [Chloroflexota bacterium]
MCQLSRDSVGVFEDSQEDIPEIFGFAKVDAHPPDPLPNGKGALSKREGAMPPLLNLFHFSWAGEVDKGDEVAKRPP